MNIFLYIIFAANPGPLRQDYFGLGDLHSNKLGKELLRSTYFVKIKCVLLK